MVSNMGEWYHDVKDLQLSFIIGHNLQKQIIIEKKMISPFNLQSTV